MLRKFSPLFLKTLISAADSHVPHISPPTQQFSTRHKHLPIPAATFHFTQPSFPFHNPNPKSDDERTKKDVRADVTPTPASIYRYREQVALPGERESRCAEIRRRVGAARRTQLPPARARDVSRAALLSMRATAASAVSYASAYVGVSIIIAV